MRSITLRIAALALCCLLCVADWAQAQSANTPPDLNGAWGQYRGGRGADPNLAPTPANPSVLCVPYGVPSMMAVAVYPIEIIQTPKQVTIVAEAFSEVRRIYLDRPQSKIDDVPPGYYGRSVGHWESGALVVDTIGIKESVQYHRVPHREQMRISESN